LKKLKDVGKGTVKRVKEFLSTGRIREIESNDPAPHSEHIQQAQSFLQELQRPAEKPSAEFISTGRIREIEDNDPALHSEHIQQGQSFLQEPQKPAGKPSVKAYSSESKPPHPYKSTCLSKSAMFKQKEKNPVSFDPVVQKEKKKPVILILESQETDSEDEFDNFRKPPAKRSSSNSKQPQKRRRPSNPPKASVWTPSEDESDDDLVSDLIARGSKFAKKKQDSKVQEPDSRPVKRNELVLSSEDDSEDDGLVLEFSSDNKSPQNKATSPNQKHQSSPFALKRKISRPPQEKRLDVVYMKPKIQVTIPPVSKELKGELFKRPEPGADEVWFTNGPFENKHLYFNVDLREQQPNKGRAENARKFFERAKQERVQCRHEMLKTGLGDYLISFAFGNRAMIIPFLFERKRADDFASSIQSGKNGRPSRLNRQLCAMERVVAEINKVCPTIPTSITVILEQTTKRWIKNSYGVDRVGGENKRHPTVESYDAQVKKLEQYVDVERTHYLSHSILYLFDVLKRIEDDIDVYYELYKNLSDEQLDFMSMDYWTKITNNTFGKPDDYHPSWYDWETKEAEERNAIYEEKQRKIEEVRRQREISEKRNLYDKAEADKKEVKGSEEDAVLFSQEMDADFKEQEEEESDLLFGEEAEQPQIEEIVVENPVPPPNPSLPPNPISMASKIMDVRNTLRILGIDDSPIMDSHIQRQIELHGVLAAKHNMASLYVTYD